MSCRYCFIGLFYLLNYLILSYRIVIHFLKRCYFHLQLHLTLIKKTSEINQLSIFEQASIEEYWAIQENCTVKTMKIMAKDELG